MHDRIAAYAESPVRPAEGDTGPSLAFERAAAAGFDTILVGDVDAVGNQLSNCMARCREHGLALWLVVSPDMAGAPTFDVDASPPVAPWLVDGAVALDPRRPARSVRHGPLATIDLDAWRRQLDAAFAVGVTGFVCRDADRLPAGAWSTLIAGAPARWVAWTPGLSPAQVAALVDAGFDTVCGSAAWWDGRAGWFVDELRGRTDVRVMAFPADPYGVSPSRDRPSLTDTARLWIAAALSDALLVPQALWDRDATDDLVAVNGWLARRDEPAIAHGGIHGVSGPDAPVTIVARSTAFDLRGSDRVTVLLVNPDPEREACVSGASIATILSGFGDYREVRSDGSTLDPCASIAIGAGAVRVFEAGRMTPIRLQLPTTRRSTEAAVLLPRLAIEAVTPSVDDGRFPVKRIVGEAVRVEADILIDGHEKLGAALLHRTAGTRYWLQVRMEPIGNDRFAAAFPLQRMGRHEFAIEAWRDVFATYRNEIDKKAAAGLDVTLELTEGRVLVDAALGHARTIRRPDVVRRLAALSKLLAARDVPLDRSTMAARVAALLASQTLADMQEADRRAFAYRTEVVYPIDAERSEASFASWYELFPRSLGNPPGTAATHHGTFDDVIDRIPAVRAMGFDVLYFPPIHPIGQRNRKGRNNSLTALEGDPGSPYAIGSPDGGHDALHPQLGTFDDFRRLREAALANGLELALDFAIQCSPDHPWLKDHPGWFAWRPDGSLRYAENPPKKYEDIVNVDFYGDDAQRGGRNDVAPALWAALRDVVLLWVEQGVRIFRVDNPHTKPLPFWEWMIGEVRAKYPDTIFLSEAFTRPKVMYRLAKVGFSQSYTYFTWRHTKQEFVDYLTELSDPAQGSSSPRDFFRPNFFVNTPDINPVFLQRSGRPGFLIRAALAATLSGLWGVYSGFELCEGTPVPGKEDYLDSEKYQLRAWDWQRPGNIVAEITALNRIRRENPALRTHLNVRFENVFDPNILYFAKTTEDLANIVLVAINLDPYGVHEADFEIPLWRWGRADDSAVDVTDLLDGHRFRWQGKVQRMRLDPAINPYAIWRIAL